MIFNRKFVLNVTLISLFPLGLCVIAGPSDSTRINSSDGKTIKHIYINSIDVSGPPLEDGKDWQPDIFGDIGNALHIKTKTWVIKNILLFKPGQALDQQSIDDSERLLRQSGYFYDARIYVEQIAGSGNVNVHVNTKDKWTLNPQISYSPKDKNGYLGLRDKNFLGIGNVVGVTITHDEDTYIGWGGQFDYTINNIKGSFVNASLNLASNNKSNLFRISFRQIFFHNKNKMGRRTGFFLAA